MGRHIVEALGRTRVVIEGDNVQVISDPLIKYCPLAAMYFRKPVPKITRGAVEENIKFRMCDFGFCRSNRILESDAPFVGFGVSEIMFSALKKGLLDCVVIVCDGAGTVITTSPRLAQGIGGRISGIVETSPIPEIIERLTSRGAIVLNPSSATIDQVQGVKTALEYGYKKIGVTITSADEAERIRQLEGKDFKVTVFAVHLTGISEAEAERIIEHSDIVTACASKWVRLKACEKAILQAGHYIPVYAFTVEGKKLLLARAEDITKSLIMFTGRSKGLDETPLPLV
ncbi:MAG: methanogenesis marker 8 protein [Candidatus Nezhaarchaeales archaeon]